MFSSQNEVTTSILSIQNIVAMNENVYIYIYENSSSRLEKNITFARICVGTHIYIYGSHSSRLLSPIFYRMFKPFSTIL
jgi:hypothetical protein